MDFDQKGANFLSLDPQPNVTEAISSSHFLYLLDFLNASRAGSAQKEAGISFQTFLSSLSISVLYCIFQVIIFSLLRCKLKNVYEAKFYFTRLVDKEDAPSERLFAWIKDVFKLKTKSYKKYGLDAYFFMRYLCFLLTLFLGLAVMNLPVLLPVNYISGYQKYTPIELELYTNGTVPIVEGLDMISMSNIAPKFTKRLSIHLTMAVISILWFHGLLIAELVKYIQVKNEYLSDESNFELKNKFHNYNNTILIENVPQRLLNRGELTSLFDKLCGARVKNIWFVYNYGEMRKLYENEKAHVSLLENLLTTEIYNKFFKRTNEFQRGKATKRYRSTYLKHVLHCLRFMAVRFKGIIPSIVVPPVDPLVHEAEKKLLENRIRLLDKKDRFIKRDHGPLLDHRYNKVFVQFKDPLHAEILNQIQISGKLNELDKTMTFINPRDVIWDNLSVQSNMLSFVRVIAGNFLSCLVILLWVIPVAFIGLISQLPYLTALIPFLSWLNFLPAYITDVISNYLSVILLMCLSELVPHLFRKIIRLKGKITGAEVELDLQRWMFVFLFIHIFLVVTISSGYTVIVEGLVNNPVSIPNILATNLPKCSNFFFSYITIRGLSYSGNNLIQNYELFCNTFVYPWTDWTPRQKFKRLSFLPEYKWGSIYPTFSVLASIGLIYSILSPLIVVFCCLSLSLVYVSFKYTLKYQYHPKPVSENFGQFYPTALFQLYSGIYFMEACLIGMFALSRDENGRANCLYHALLTFLLMIATAAAQNQIRQMFGALLEKNSPLTLTRSASTLDELEPKSASVDEALFNDTFYEPCFQHCNNILWLPKDQYNISLQEISRLSSLCIESSSTYTYMTDDGEIEVFGAPPDNIEED